MRDLGRLSLLSPEEEYELALQVRAGSEAARQRMIESNLRLVVIVARRYAGRGILLMDLVAEGNLGLIHAVGKYDPELGFRFSTYSVLWIRHHIERALMSQGRTVRLPVQVAKEYNAFARAARLQTQKLQHEPSPRELAERLGRELADIERLLGLSERVYSINTPLDEDSDTTFAEVLADPASVEPAQELHEQSLIQHLDQMLDRLPERERTVMLRRFGLRGHEACTLEEVAAVLDISRERARQIQLGAQRRLHSFMQAAGLDQELVLG